MILLHCLLHAGCAWSPISPYAATSRRSSSPSIAHPITRDRARNSGAISLEISNITRQGEGSRFGQRSPEQDGAEVRAIIVSIKILTAFEETDHEIGKRCGYNFVGDLKNPLCEDGSEDQVRRNDAPEGYADEDARIKPLTHQRGADGPRPQPASAGSNFQFRKYERVGKLANQVGYE